MKKSSWYAALLILPVVIMTASGCGGGGGGGGAPGPAPYAINPATVRIAAGARAKNINPVVAQNDSGIALAAWTAQRSEYYGTILFSVYSGGAWSQENAVADIDPYYDVAIACNGTDFMIAYERSGHYFVRRYNVVSGLWDPETQVDSGESHYGQVSIASSGTGFAVTWVQYEGGVANAYANVYTGGAWSGATLVESGAGGVDDYYGPMIAGSAVGYAVAWVQYDGAGSTGYRSIYANTYSAATGTWATAVSLESGNGNAFQPRIASNGAGSYCVTWAQYDGTGFSGFLNAYASVFNGTTWVPAPAPLDTGAATVGSPQVASTGTGTNYAVTWGYGNVSARVYSGGTWTGETLLENGSGTARYPAIASSGSGYAAVWIQNDGSADSVYVNIYSGATWTVAKLLENASGAAESPQIAGRAGSYTAVWSQFEGTAMVIYASRLSSGAWTAPASLVTRSYIADSLFPKMAGDNSGNRMAVWDQYHNGSFYIYGSLFSNGAWGPSFVTGGTATASASQPQIASNGSGYAVVWHQYDAGSSSLYANVYEGGAWSGPILLELGSGSLYTGLERITSNGSGYAVTWVQDDGGAYSIYANVYAGGAWSGATILESSNNAAYYPQIISNGGGYAVTWRQSDGSATSIYASVYTNNAWSAATVLESGSGVASTPQIASNGSGYAVVWPQNDGTVDSIYASVYANSAWSIAALVESGPGTASSPKIVSNGSGYAVAWLHSDGSLNSVSANVYAGNDWGGPALLETGAGNVSSFVIASNGSGYAVAWRQNDGSTDSMYASVYANNAWSIETLVESGTSTASSPQIVSNGSGYAVLWFQSDGSVSSISANVFNGTWGTATLLETGTGAANYAQLIRSGSGYCAAWSQTDPGSGVNADAYEIWTAAF